MAKLRKTWREKLADSKGFPRVVEVNEKMSQKWGTGTVVIPAPLEVDEIMRQVPGRQADYDKPDKREAGEKARRQLRLTDNHRHLCRHSGSCSRGRGRRGQKGHYSILADAERERGNQRENTPAAWQPRPGA